MNQSLCHAAITVLHTAEPAEKVRLSRLFAAAWRGGGILDVGCLEPPARPARPARPVLRQPRDMPKRRAGGPGRVALLHALAHIELNAIDLAWDVIARFTNEALPRTFYDDWVTVVDEEAQHHGLLADRLASLGAAYGDLPAHDGLWQAAAATAHDLLARLAVVPLVLEARGLDVTPVMIAKCESAGESANAHVLRVIYEDEIGHVAIGKRWFDFLCQRRDLEPVSTWQGLVRRHFTGTLRPPFNTDGRAAAGFPSSYYEALDAP